MAHDGLLGSAPWWAEVVAVARALSQTPETVLRMPARHYQWVVAVLNAESSALKLRAKDSGRETVPSRRS